MAEMSPEPIFMHLDSTDKQAMARLNRGFDTAAPMQRERQRRSAHACRCGSPRFSWTRVRKVSVLQLLDAACLMERICVVCLQRGRVCGRHV